MNGACIAWGFWDLRDLKGQGVRGFVLCSRLAFGSELVCTALVHSQKLTWEVEKAPRASLHASLWSVGCGDCTRGPTGLKSWLQSVPDAHGIPKSSDSGPLASLKALDYGPLF